MTVVLPLAHDLAVIAALETTTRPVGFAEAPDGALEAVQGRPVGPGYFIVYPVQGGGRDGSLADPFADAELVYQITTVARTAQEVRWLVGLIEPALAGLEVDGRVVWQVEPEDGGVLLDRDVDPPVFYSTPRFRLRSSPA